MMIDSDLKALYLRDLDRLNHELESYKDEELLWAKVNGINNSAGNLFMHVCGNLQHFAGAILNENGYERNRDFEFNGRMEVEELKGEISATRLVIENYFSKNTDASLTQKYPLQPFGYSMTVNYFLIHLNGHLNYHLGQINYHRRILSETS